MKDLYRPFRNSLATQLLFRGFAFVFAGTLPEQIYQIYFLKKVLEYTVSEVYRGNFYVGSLTYNF